MTGNIDASIITGQGINALLSTVDSQIQVAQNLIAVALADAASFDLEMDERFWPEMEIGRASCRERVCQYVSISGVAVSLKKKREERNKQYKNRKNKKNR